jgi:hypothetical protein
MPRNDTPGALFEELGFKYVGPVDGHRLDHLLEAGDVRHTRHARPRALGQLADPEQAVDRQLQQLHRDGRVAVDVAAE